MNLNIYNLILDTFMITTMMASFKTLVGIPMPKLLLLILVGLVCMGFPILIPR